jgi:hypothetical protein
VAFVARKILKYYQTIDILTKREVQRQGLAGSNAIYVQQIELEHY